MKIMAFATALTLALGALTLPFSESGYNFAYKAVAKAIIFINKPPLYNYFINIMDVMSILLAKIALFLAKLN